MTAIQDSTNDTIKHKNEVKKILCDMSMALILRAHCHDDTKLQNTEKETLDHHYKNNRHHPEFHPVF